MTPLHMAADADLREAEADALEATVELLRAGADPLVANDLGASALYIATVSSHPAIAVEMLKTLERRDEEDGMVYPAEESRVGKAIFKSDRRLVGSCVLVSGAGAGAVKGTRILSDVKATNQRTIMQNTIIHNAIAICESLP